MDNAVQIPMHAADPYGSTCERKEYEAPTLTDFGSCAELTAGTFAGVGPDSGIYS